MTTPITQTSQSEAQTYQYITRRIVPFLFICYLVAMIDRLNVSFAKLQFMADLHLSETQFGFAASLLYVGYILFEVPSNLMLQKSGIRLTLLRIMTTWGLMTVLLAFARNAGEFYVIRFLIGAAEAGFLPGVLLYLTYWYPDHMRGRITSLFVAAVPVSGILGGPLAGWIMTATHGSYGLRGWQCLFLLEGLPAVVLGTVAYFYLSDRPATTSWLSAAQRIDVARAIATTSALPATHTGTFRSALRDVRVWGLALTYFVFYCLENALLVWIPTLLRSVGGISVMEIGWLGGGISVAAMVGMLAISRSSDRRGERRWHVIGCGLVAGGAFLVLPFAAHSVVGTTLLLMVASITVFAFLALFWTIPSAYLRGTSTAGGLALISSIGSAGGVVSPLYIGWMKELTNSFYGALGSLGALLMIAMVVLYACFRNSDRPARITISATETA
jgi:sugar phosphate permease